MMIELLPHQREAQAEFRMFADREIKCHASDYDRNEYFPRELIQKIAQKGYLGATLPKEYNGIALDMVTYGLLNEEFGRVCSSARSLLTVHNMVAHTLHRWGSQFQKFYWIPQMVSGQVVVGFALSEVNAGSDAKKIEATATISGNSYILSGKKKWITFGQIADLFLVFAKHDGNPTAFLIERDTPGLTVHPIRGILGVRASMLAELHLDQCRIPLENCVGPEGLGLSHIASTAIDQGRYSIAWGCVGILQACIEICVQYTSQRKQFDVFLKDHQLIQQMMAEMIVSAKAARLLCYQAGYLRDSGNARAITETIIAKYFASTSAMKAATDAVQIHGANGCSQEHAPQRFWRDAKVMEIIEGTNQIQQITIAQCGYQEYWSLDAGAVL